MSSTKLKLYIIELHIVNRCREYCIGNLRTFDFSTLSHKEWYAVQALPVKRTDQDFIKHVVCSIRRWRRTAWKELTARGDPLYIHLRPLRRLPYRLLSGYIEFYKILVLRDMLQSARQRRRTAWKGLRAPRLTARGGTAVQTTTSSATASQTAPVGRMRTGRRACSTKR